MISVRPQEDSPRAVRLVLAAFVFVTIYFTGVFPPRANPNDLAHFQTVVAMAEWRTFSINRAIALLGDHEDKAASGGLFYSNKGPGLSFAAYPLYLALRTVLPRPSSGTFDPIFLAVRFLTVSLASILALRRLARRIAAEARDESVAALVVLAVAFGTPMLFYARSFFSHLWTASLLFFAWELLRGSGEAGVPAWRWSCVLAGFLAGFAVISEYTVAPIAAVLAIRAAVPLPRARRFLEFGLGALPPLALLLVYNAAAFGSPFVLSYVREATPDLAAVSSHGFVGFRPPSPRVALDYLFHPARGVLAFSPFLAWSVLGVVRWWRSGRNRADCAFVLAAIPLFFVPLCGYPDWHGGGSLGSRYLLPGLFLVAVPIGHALDGALSRGLFVAAATFSVANHFVLTATYPHFWLDFPWPAATASLWLLEQGFVAPNLASLAGAGPLAALALPAIATLVVLLASARLLRPTRPRLSAAFALGAAPLALLLLLPPTLPFEARLRRASLLDSYSSVDPQGTAVQSVAREAKTEEERRRADRAWHSLRVPTKTP